MTAANQTQTAPQGDDAAQIIAALDGIAAERGAAVGHSAAVELAGLALFWVAKHSGAAAAFMDVCTIAERLDAAHPSPRTTPYSVI